MSKIIGRLFEKFGVFRLMSLSVLATLSLSMLIILTIPLTLSAQTQIQPHTQAPAQDQNTDEYDIIIRNATFYDGTGADVHTSDIGISGMRIAYIGDLSMATALREIDATLFIMAPGFIDTHSHASTGLIRESTSGAEQLLAQGLTTVFINPDGGGNVDLAQQQEQLLRHGIGVNVAQFVPHGSIRREVIGMANRFATDEELGLMQTLVEEGMKNGAFGLSSGPYYPPGSFSNTHELVELSKVAAQYGGIYQSHIRDESDYTIGVVAAVEEVIEIAEKASITGIVTHIKLLGPNVWGLSDTLIARIQHARERGISIFADQYPYEASATGLSPALVPSWALDGGRDAFLSRLDDPAQFQQIRDAMHENLARRGGAERIMMRTVSFDESLNGRFLHEIATEMQLDPIDAAIVMLRRDSPGIVSFNMLESDIHKLMRQPWTMTASDGTLEIPDFGVPHPRGFGTFPRKIRKYALDDGIVDLSFAIRSMTGLPADVYSIENRGYIREGFIADIVLFDAETFRDLSVYDDPHQYAVGVEYVLVNGQFAIDAGVFTDSSAGELLRLRRE